MKFIEISNFFTPQECQQLIDLCKDKMVPAMSPDPANNFKPIKSIQQCNNWVTYLRPGDHPVVEQITKKMEAYTGRSRLFYEPIQMLRYDVGQYYRFHCVPEGQILLGDNKPINEYHIGDKVTGRSGVNSVKQTFSREYNGQVLQIKGYGMLPFQVTPEHPILAVEGSGQERSHRKVSYSEPKWKTAAELAVKHYDSNGDYLIMPQLPGSFEESAITLERQRWKDRKRLRGRLDSFPINEETAWLLGAYVAEGSSTSGKLIRFTISSEEIEFRDRLMAVISTLGHKSCISKTPAKAINVVFGSVTLAPFLKRVCGASATTKKIPDFILYHKRLEVLKAFLDGYIEGDGYRPIVDSYGQVAFNTVSKVLAQQLQLAYARLGLFLSIGLSRKAQRRWVIKQMANQHEQYYGRFFEKAAKNSHLNRLHNDSFYLPISKISRHDYNGKVYNIETTDNTYLISNVVTHNCDNSYPQDPNPRKSTFQVYLNTVQEGGETHFSKLGIKFKPVQGKAVYWYNFGTDRDMENKPSAELNTEHEGMTIIKGVKWSITQWIKLWPIGSTSRPQTLVPQMVK